MEAKGNPYREAALEELEKINQSQEERYRYLSREKAILDKYSELKNAETRGHMKGRLEGKLEDRIETVIEILEELGTVSSELRRKISAQTNLDVLKNWTKLAAKSKSIEEFEAVLEDEKN